MATTVVWQPHAGACWLRAVELWRQATANNAQTPYWTVGSSNGHRFLEAGNIASGVVSSETLVDMSCPDTEVYSFEYVQQLAGIRAMPVVFNKGGGATELVQKYMDVVAFARQAWMALITGWTTTLIAGYDFNTTLPPIRTIQQIWAVKKGIKVGTDWIVAQGSTTTVAAGNPTQAVSANTGQPSLSPAMVVSSGGVGDLTEIVEALNDIALRDVDYVANNGSTVFSMRGRVNAG